MYDVADAIAVGLAYIKLPPDLKHIGWVLQIRGIVGMLAFAWLIYGLFQVGLRTWRDHPDGLLSGLSAGLVAGLVGLLVHAFGANTFIIVRIMEPLWLFAGILIALVSINQETSPESAL